MKLMPENHLDKKIPPMLKRLSIVIVVVLCVFSCSNTSRRESDWLGVFPKTPNEGKIGVFQNVEYIQYKDNCIDPECDICKSGVDGVYYLDTWACTKNNQGHDHDVPSNNGFVGYWLGEEPPPYPYDSLVYGSYEYIKSVKPVLFAIAKAVFNSDMAKVREEKRTADSLANAYKLKQDSAKILNGIKSH